jgi:hypothetical protein
MSISVPVSVRMTARSIALATLGLALLASGCGSDGSEVDQEGDGNAGRGRATELHSGVVEGRFEFRLVPHGPGLRGESTTERINFVGPFERDSSHRLPDFDLAVRMHEGGVDGTEVPFGLIATSDAGYVEYQDQGYVIDQSVFDRLSSASPLSGLHPARWISNPSREGREDIDGAESIHRSGEANVERFVAELVRAAKDLGLKPGRLEVRQRDFDSATLDLFTGVDDGIVRRVELKLASHGSSDDYPAFDARIHASTTLTNVNEDQQIEAPQDAAPIGELVPKLPFQLSGLGEFVSGKTTSGGP